MVNEKSLLDSIQTIFDGLYDANLIDHPVAVSYDTELLGDNSVLDSIAFITLFSDLEDDLNKRLGKEIFLVLDEINRFDINAPQLNVRILAQYVLEKTNSVN